MQCHNGHTLCSTCKTRVQNRCPTCRQELGDIRCLALEKVAESLELPCKYYSLGCPEIFPYYSKLKHEATCNFRPYNCPYAGSECSVVGDIPFLVAHLRDDHKVDMHTGCTFNHRYVKSNPREVENATWMLTVSVKIAFRLFGWISIVSNMWCASIVVFNDGVRTKRVWLGILVLFLFFCSVLTVHTNSRANRPTGYWPCCALCVWHFEARLKCIICVFCVSVCPCHCKQPIRGCHWKKVAQLTKQFNLFW